MSVFRSLLFVISIACVFSLGGCVTKQSLDSLSTSADVPITDPWWLSGKAALQQRLNVKTNNRTAKNVILFIGDGMGISTVTAARIFDGQSRGESGEENVLSFEHFPHVALIKTYSVDAQVPDSAATASAMNTGVKTRFASVGIWADQPVDDCYGPQTNFPKTLAEIAESIGMSTGFATTDKITYATPAAVYAHSPLRTWEDDASMPEEARLRGCKDIAQQLMDFPYGDGLDVMLGGGYESLLPVSKGGKRLDNQDLIANWQQRHPRGRYIHSAEELRTLKSDGEKTQKILGVFAPRHLAYSMDKNTEEEPTLAEMTSAAIDQLSTNPKGYFLMVENGHIDHAHHNTNAIRALSDTQAFAHAIEIALEKIDLNDTLVLVTADHSHPLTMVGYPKRGNSILGLVEPGGIKGPSQVINGLALSSDKRPYTTLGYRIGPHTRSSSEPISTEDTLSEGFHQQSGIAMPSGFHGGEDVALYATGPQSHLVGGVLEQNVIFHIISQALGWNAD